MELTQEQTTTLLELLRKELSSMGIIPTVLEYDVEKIDIENKKIIQSLTVNTEEAGEMLYPLAYTSATKAKNVRNLVTIGKLKPIKDFLTGKQTRPFLFLRSEIINLVQNNK